MLVSNYISFYFKMDRVKEELREITNKLNEEFRLEFPSYNLLEKLANRIIGILNNLEDKSKEYEHFKDYLKQDLEIYITDLVDIEDDYRKKLSRYRNKWLLKYDELNSFIDRIRTIE